VRAWAKRKEALDSAALQPHQQDVPISAPYGTE
jgi:hypothetical protein